jgi:hypothetical protein
MTFSGGPSIGIGIASRKRAKPARTFDALIILAEFNADAGAEADEFRQSE